MSFEDVAYLASDQAGLFTTAQAAALGVDRGKLHRRLHSGVLRSPRRGIYAFESTPLGPDEELRAAWLSLDPSRTVAQRLKTPEDIVVCTTSAAAHYGIGDFETPQHEFYTARRKQTRADDIRLRIRTLDADDVDIRQGLPVTTPSRIVLDLLSERFDLGHISRMIADAVKQGLHIDWPRIVERSPEFSREYGLTTEGLLSALAEASESPSDAARTAVSMIGSHPDISRYFTRHLAESMKEISAMMVSPQLAEVSENMRRIVDHSPAMQEMQRHNAQLAEKMTAHLPAIPFPTIFHGFDLDNLREGRPQTRDETTDADDEE